MLTTSGRAAPYGNSRLLAVDTATGRVTVDLALSAGFRWSLLTDDGARVVVFKQGAVTEDQIVVVDLATKTFQVATTVPQGAVIRGRGTVN